jgi:hypothetical protein
MSNTELQPGAGLKRLSAVLFVCRLAEARRYWDSAIQISGADITGLSRQAKSRPLLL